MSARPSFFEKGILLTKHFHASQSWHQLSFYESKILVQNCLLNEWILDSNKFCLKLPDLTAGMAPFLFSPTDGAASEITEENVASLFSMILIIRLPLSSVPSNKSLTLLVVEWWLPIIWATNWQCTLDKELTVSEVERGPTPEVERGPPRKRELTEFSVVAKRVEKNRQNQ